jgi:hypothetical protein
MNDETSLETKAMQGIITHLTLAKDIVSTSGPPSAVGQIDTALIIAESLLRYVRADRAAKVINQLHKDAV